ncbi:efflux RND transporter permease subunit [Simiduia agarivorans]|uniref:Efflux pump membrane transporter n=1 Tax=Simiduia agarivorans (strain DSM 21679 / JCM 13881 / BCRC 17597 / SA1) TaxID=1117647 RepID=K4KJM8_SIMAS|nr:efflux RND transporter permease subunit [Simiduia agarivorans]AFU99359.1 hydrophobe/amphiphile efflux-1 (HAE1) family protein [Simiduia agarivorans SA1 = DSM 21679]
MIAAHFLDRPVKASVISIVITLVGLIAVFTLPIDQYPYISPPSVKVSTSFPGASARTASESVATPIEQELNGTPNMLYMRSSSSKSGGVNITLTFEVGTDPDFAAIDVQNRAKQADANLPVDVMQEGVSVDKESAVELLKLAITSTDPKYDDIYLSNYATINIEAALRRIPGVGRTRNTGARSYSMRVWLRPDYMTAHGLTTSDVINAIKEQNTEAAAGSLGGQPTKDNVTQSYPITTQGRLSSPDEFGNVIVRADSSGAMIRLRDVARIELESSAYTLESKLNGKDAAILQVYLMPGANALQVAAQVKATMAELAGAFPQGLQWQVWYDGSLFIAEAIKEVILTLAEALLLVVLVVFLFLQNWRTTLIPALAVPVSIIGTFAAMQAFGFTLNTVNLLALVLAIGIVVDDAIVVVESVERIMKDTGASALEATRQAMAELSGALVATSLVLAAVFVPVAFLPGISGILYREFAVAITVAVLISTLVALTLSPALCTLLLTRSNTPPPARLRPVFTRVDQWLARGGQVYETAVRACLHHRRRALVGFCALLGATFLLFKYLPASFMPVEDQGRFFVDLELPDGASVARSRLIASRAQAIAQQHPAVAHVFSLAGESKRSGGDEADATLEVILKDWSEREGVSVDQVMNELAPAFDTILETTNRVFKPSAIAGLGNSNGVELELQDRSGTHWQQLPTYAEQLSRAVQQHPAVKRMSTDFKSHIPLYELEVDRATAKAIGVPLADIYSTMRTFTGSSSVNDFNLFGRVYRVKVQAEGNYRDRPDAIRHYYVRSNSGDMVPIEVLADLKFTTGPANVVRYNMFSSASLVAEPNTGYSSGEVIRAIQSEASKLLPPGMGYEWTGLTFQEIRSGGQTQTALLLALVFVFLFLAALYESWIIPLAVLTIAPVAMLGALAASWLGGVENNLFFQIAFVALIGLAAKNSILIVEYCNTLVREGVSPVEAAITAARQRFRPIMMTSVSFILGVMPLVLSAGPGAIARQSMSIPILGGMLLATSVGIVLVPLFFVVLAKRLQAREVQS